MDPSLEMQMLNHVQGIERHLNRLANVAEAREKRERAEHAIDVHLDEYPAEVQELIARLLVPGVGVKTNGA